MGELFQGCYLTLCPWDESQKWNWQPWFCFHPCEFLSSRGLFSSGDVSSCQRRREPFFGGRPFSAAFARSSRGSRGRRTPEKEKRKNCEFWKSNKVSASPQSCLTISWNDPVLRREEGDGGHIPRMRKRLPWHFLRLDYSTRQSKAWTFSQ